jgi:glycosyltransferase involved in cell wall biosynthesis
MVAHAMSALAWMNWHLIVAGAGPRRQEVEALFCAVPGRPDRHVPVATDGDLIDLLAASDLFIWPSLDEEFSLVAVEAQAAGIGIVAGKSPAMADVVANGRTGMLVKLDNEASFANGVSFLLRHPEFRRTYAQEGPRWAVMNFDLAVVATQLDAALHRIVRAAGGEDAAPSLRPVG